MKNTIITAVLLWNLSVAFAQHNPGSSVFLESKTKGGNHYYVELNNTSAVLYRVGSLWDKGGSWYNIGKTDTLALTSRGNYTGKNAQLIKEENVSYLITGNKKPEKLLLATVKDPGDVHKRLNNAYFFRNYFSLVDEINKTYPLHHHSFRGAFGSWDQLANKEAGHEQFRQYTDIRLKELKDSISAVHDKYTALATQLLQNIKTISYPDLKSGLSRLPADFVSMSKYFTMVVSEVAKQRPKDFFRLAEDMPESKTVIFFAAGNDKEVVRQLRAVKSHNEVKEEFFKERRFGRGMQFGILTACAVGVGAIAWQFFKRDRSLRISLVNLSTGQPVN